MSSSTKPMRPKKGTPESKQPPEKKEVAPVDAPKKKKSFGEWIKSAFGSRKQEKIVRKPKDADVVTAKADKKEETPEEIKEEAHAEAEAEATVEPVSPITQEHGETEVHMDAVFYDKATLANITESQLTRYYSWMESAEGDMPLEENWKESSHFTFITRGVFYLTDETVPDDEALAILTVYQKEEDPEWTHQMQVMKEIAMEQFPGYLDHVGNVRMTTLEHAGGMYTLLQGYLESTYGEEASADAAAEVYKSEFRTFVEQAANGLYLTHHHACTDKLPDVSSYSLIELGLTESGELLEEYKKNYNIFMRSQTAIRNMCKCKRLTTSVYCKEKTLLCDFELPLYHVFNVKGDQGPAQAKRMATYIGTHKEEYPQYTSVFNLVPLISAYCSANMAMAAFLALDNPTERANSTYQSIQDLFIDFEETRHQQETEALGRVIREEIQDMLDGRMNQVFKPVLEAVDMKDQIQDLDTELRAKIKALEASLRDQELKVEESYKRELEELRRSPQYMLVVEPDEQIETLKGHIQRDQAHLQQEQEMKMKELQEAHTARLEHNEQVYKDTIHASSRALKAALDTIREEDTNMSSKFEKEQKTIASATIQGLLKNANDASRKERKDREISVNKQHEQRVAEADALYNAQNADSGALYREGIQLLTMDAREKEMLFSHRHRDLEERTLAQRELLNEIELSRSAAERKVLKRQADEIEVLREVSAKARREVEGMVIRDRQLQTEALLAAKEQMKDDQFKHLMEPVYRAWNAFVLVLTEVTQTQSRFSAIPPPQEEDTSRAEFHTVITQFLDTYISDWKMANLHVLNMEIETMITKLQKPRK